MGTRYLRAMALIACLECGAEISDKAPSCPRCGVPLLTESKLIVAAPAQAFLVSPKIRVELDGREVARLKKGELAEFPVAADVVARFSVGPRSATVRVAAGRVTRVQLSWDRISGGLIAREVETIVGR